MPTLLPSAWTVVSPVVPCVWSCSECQAAFDIGPLHGSPPTQAEIDRINRVFAVHCKQVHPGSLPVTGIGPIA
jgi:hypothetical protein